MQKQIIIIMTTNFSTYNTCMHMDITDNASPLCMYVLRWFLRVECVPLSRNSSAQLMKSNIRTVPSSEQVAILESFGEKLREKQAGTCKGTQPCSMLHRATNSQCYYSVQHCCTGQET